MGGEDKGHLRALGPSRQNINMNMNRTSLIKHPSWKQGRGMLKPMTPGGHGEWSIGFDSTTLCKIFLKQQEGETRVGLGNKLTTGKVASQQWYRLDSRHSRLAGKRSRKGLRLKLRDKLLPVTRASSVAEG